MCQYDVTVGITRSEVIFFGTSILLLSHWSYYRSSNIIRYMSTVETNDLHFLSLSVHFPSCCSLSCRISSSKRFFASGSTMSCRFRNSSVSVMRRSHRLKACSDWSTRASICRSSWHQATRLIVAEQKSSSQRYSLIYFSGSNSNLWYQMVSKILILDDKSTNCRVEKNLRGCKKPFPATICL